MAPSRPSDDVKAANLEADSVQVSPISVYEIARKAQRGKWPEVIPHLGALVADGQTVRRSSTSLAR